MPQVDIITEQPRHRIWSRDAKLSILEAAFAPGANRRQVAKRANISTGQLYTWRKRLWGSSRNVSFAPIIAVTDRPALQGQNINEAMSASSGLSDRATTRDDIVIEFQGKRAWIPSSISPDLAAAIIAALVKA